MPSLTVAQIAALCQAEFRGDGDRLITGANTIEEAGADELAFVARRDAGELAGQSRAGCLIVKRDFVANGPWATIAVDEPRGVFATVLTTLYAKPGITASRHPTAVIDATARIGENTSIGPLTAVGANVTIGDGCEIGAGCVLADNIRIGDGSILHANVTVYAGVQIGSRAVIHSGCVIGSDGFGFARVGKRYQKFPQVGTVVLGDDVELGANTCIDRAALGRTVIGNGCKLDNLVHVAHNVRIGENVVVAAQTGFSGGVTIGAGAVVGGQVGVGDKATIDPEAIVGSGSGILTSARVRAGEPVWGVPARPLRKHLKGLAYVNRLEAFQKELKILQRQMKELQLHDRENKKA